MAEQTVQTLQLVKRTDQDSGDLNTLDLLSLPTELQYQGWQQALPQPGAPSVDEVVTLLMNAGNYDTLATALQAIDTKIKETQWAQDPLNPIGVWLRTKLSSETNARQSFVLAMNRPQAGLGITNPLAYQGIVPDYGLGITRMPVWENVLAQSIGGSAITAHGGTVSYTVAGDAHGRVAKVQLDGVGGAGYTEAWFGVKSSRYGVNPANFVPIWNLDKNSYTGGGLPPDTTTSADATALDGTKLVCTFSGTPTMDYRAIVPLSAVTSNYSDQRGKYTVLIRAKTTNATLKANLRVGAGYINNSSTPRAPASFTFQPRFQIPYVDQTPNATTGWKYYTLGQVKIPATSGVWQQPLKHTAIGIQAEYVSGSGNLEMDSLMLIPAEHSIHTANTVSIIGAGLGITLYVLTRPDKRYTGVVYFTTDDSIIESPAPDAIDWSIPSGSGVIVCGASGSSSLVADQMTPTFTVYPSYNSLRGSV